MNKHNNPFLADELKDGLEKKIEKWKRNIDDIDNKNLSDQNVSNE